MTNSEAIYNAQKKIVMTRDALKVAMNRAYGNKDLLVGISDNHQTAIDRARLALREAKSEFDSLVKANS